jgi:hypothetical protein
VGHVSAETEDVHAHGCFAFTNRGERGCS